MTDCKITKAVIPVAGFGTRMLPASKAIPKELLPVVDEPAIQYVVNEAVAAGITEIVLVSHASKAAIENHFDGHPELEAQVLGHRDGICGMPGGYEHLGAILA